MFNSKRIKRLEDAIKGRPYSFDVSPYGGIRENHAITGLIERVENQKQEIIKLKDIVRELTDFVYENVEPKNVKEGGDE